MCDIIRTVGFVPVVLTIASGLSLPCVKHMFAHSCPAYKHTKVCVPCVSLLKLMVTVAINGQWNDLTLALDFYSAFEIESVHLCFDKTNVFVSISFGTHFNVCTDLFMVASLPSFLQREPM